MGHNGETDLLQAGRLVLPAEAGSPRRARAFAARNMAASGCTDDEISAATLVVSELVTNAVQHARTEATLQVSVHGDRVVLALEDGSPELPTWRDSRHWDTGGRGLTIMSALGEVAVVGSPTGKVIEVTIRRQ